MSGSSRIRMVLPAVLIAVVAIGAYYLLTDLLVPSEEEIAAKTNLPAPTKIMAMENSAHGQVSQVMPTDANKVSPADGASFLGGTFVPRSKDSVLRVRVTLAGFSAEDNEMVLAVFADNTPGPARLVIKPVAANSTVVINEEFDLPARLRDPIQFDFRVGPGRPGLIILNGPSDQPAAEGRTTIKITEE